MFVERLFRFLQLFATNALTKVCWAASLILLLRSLGPEQFGTLVTLWALSSLAAGVTDLGVSQVLLREGARQPEIARSLAKQVLRIQIGVSVLVAILLMTYAEYVIPVKGVSASTRVWIIFCAVAASLIDRFQNLFTVFSQLTGGFKRYMRWRSLGFVAALAGFGITVRANGGLAGVSSVYLFAMAATSIFMGQSTWNALPDSGTSSAEHKSIDLLRNGLPFLSVSVLTLAYGRVEVSILGSIGQISMAGTYHAIYQIVLLAYSLSAIWFTVVYPKLYEYRGDKLLLSSDFSTCARSLAFLAWCCALPLFLYAKPISAIIVGGDSAAAIQLLRWLALLILLMPGTAALNFLLPLDLIWQRVICDALGIAVTVSGVLLAASAGSMIGIALSATVGYASAIAVASFFVRKSVSINWHVPWCALSSLACRALPLGALLWALSIPWWIGSCIYLTLFFTATLLTGYFSPKEIAIWRQLRTG